MYQPYYPYSCYMELFFFWPAAGAGDALSGGVGVTVVTDEYSCTGEGGDGELTGEAEAGG